MNEEYQFLSSEVKELQSILASIPQENVIERLSFEARLKAVEDQLAQLPPEQNLPQKARLTFRGKPVFGSYGIAADFATKAAGAFTDAVAAIAAGLNESLGVSGPIPDREKNMLMITGTAVGSFGFEFELPTENSMFQETSRAEEALNKIQNLFRLSVEGNDDEITELVQDIHPRATRKVHDFLTFLLQQQAWCGFEFKDHYFRYGDMDQLRQSTERLKEENIKETEEIFQGEFQGVLPAGRTFEFKTSDQRVLRGKIDLSIEDPDALNRDWLHKGVSVKLKVIIVGQGRPRYTLLSLEDITVS